VASSNLAQAESAVKTKVSQLSVPDR